MLVGLPSSGVGAWAAPWFVSTSIRCARSLLSWALWWAVTGVDGQAHDIFGDLRREGGAITVTRRRPYLALDCRHCPFARFALPSEIPGHSGNGGDDTRLREGRRSDALAERRLETERGVGEWARRVRPNETGKPARERFEHEVLSMRSREGGFVRAMSRRAPAAHLSRRAWAQSCRAGSWRFRSGRPARQQRADLLAGVISHQGSAQRDDRSVAIGGTYMPDSAHASGEVDHTHPQFETTLSRCVTETPVLPGHDSSGASHWNATGIRLHVMPKTFTTSGPSTITCGATAW